MGMDGFRETRESVGLMKDYCDHIGVTDKYTGYRHNLNRGSRQPVTLGYDWLKNTPPPQYPPPPIASSWAPSPASNYRPRTTGQLSASIGQGNPVSDMLRATPNHQHAQRSVQERCGINTTFPGRTEYMNRYHRAVSAPGPHVQEINRGYTLNPSPDFEGVARRPLAIHTLTRHHTEYQNRYTFPDGSTIEKFPWLRK